MACVGLPGIQVTASITVVSGAGLTHLQAQISQAYVAWHSRWCSSDCPMTISSTTALHLGQLRQGGVFSLPGPENVPELASGPDQAWLGTCLGTAHCSSSAMLAGCELDCQLHGNDKHIRDCSELPQLASSASTPG